MQRLRQYFVTGLLVWLPAAITAWVLLWLVGILNGVFRAILAGIETIIPRLAPLFDQLRSVPGLGVILVAIIIFATGVFVANMVGQWWLRRWDALMTRIPVVRSIYSSVKQVSDTLFSGSGQAFSRALLIQYPREGAWTLAFLTGRPGGEVARHLAERHEQAPFISVYVPTTPNPTSGFFLMVPRAHVIELDMSVDEALKYVISMGVVAPPERASAAAPAPVAAPAALPAARAESPSLPGR